MYNFRHKIRRGLAVFLALVMCMSLAMVPAYAVDEDSVEAIGTTNESENLSKESSTIEGENTDEEEATAEDKSLSEGQIPTESENTGEE